MAKLLPFCVICGAPIIPTSSAVVVRTEALPESWVHEGECYALFAAEFQQMLTTPRDEVRAIFERACAAGRIRQ